MSSLETPKSPLNVMHLIDSLVPGGAETVAVNLCNAQQGADIRAHLCVTRNDGALRSRIHPHVPVLYLKRTGRFDFQAIRQLASYVAQHQIKILHAHGTSVFVAILSKFLRPGVRIVWHDHYGRQLSTRPVRTYQLMTSQVSAIVGVNDSLVDWAVQQLHFPRNRVWYVPNFVEIPEQTPPEPELPGARSHRIVCVANFRPQKDHFTLIRAMREIVDRVPEAQLLLVGLPVDAAYLEQVEQLSRELKLDQNVSFLGGRDDVSAVLAHSAIGVLSSESEGLPLALLEYGAARCATVTTDAGQCRKVLDNGRVGKIVPIGSHSELAQGVIDLLEAGDKCRQLGELFHQQIVSQYGRDNTLARLREVYKAALGNK